MRREGVTGLVSVGPSLLPVAAGAAKAATVMPAMITRAGMLRFKYMFIKFLRGHAAFVRNPDRRTVVAQVVYGVFRSQCCLSLLGSNLESVAELAPIADKAIGNFESGITLGMMRHDPSAS